jgi:putative addiction module CopG family antidote
MSIRLPADVEEQIRKNMQSGPYEDAADVVRSALMLLEGRDRRLRELRESIAAGLNGIERGNGYELTPELIEEIDREADDGIERGLIPKPDVCP